VQNPPSIAKYSRMFGVPLVLRARLGLLHLIVATMCNLPGFCLIPMIPGQQRSARCDIGTPVDETRILESMTERGLELARAFNGYRAVRTFQAENKRFNKKAVMVVETTVQKGHYSASRLISFEGSELIRNRVFEKILEAEADAEKQGREVDLTTANYRFRFEGVEAWKGRDNYIFSVTPLKKNKYAVIGRIWLDCDDFQIARIQGSPSKRPSFWTLSVRIEKEYQKQEGRWLPFRTFSESSVLFAGKSTLAIDYAY
jgi:hypothetical protein